ncbi:glycosyltransferase family 4 protein, partial [Escherichia coli]|nr:glycosyltransferase family 4 protein [Escherichia coli]
LYKNNNDLIKNYATNAEFRFSINIERFLRCRNFCSEATIFHSSYYRLPERQFRGKIITTVHDFTDEIYPRNAYAKILSYQKKKTILNSDGIICISDNTKRDLLNFIPEAKGIPIKVIYNGVGDFSYNPDCVRNIASFKQPYALFVGGRKKYKNFNVCVQTLSQYKNINLVIVGGGDLDFQELKMLNRYLKGRYYKKGYVDDQQLNNLYTCALFLFYPSQYEGFGIPVLEAMKSGCPVIATDCSSVREIASGYALLAKEATVEQFSKCINLLLDESFREKMIYNGLHYAKKFTWDKCFSDTVSFYDEVRYLK